MLYILRSTPAGQQSPNLKIRLVTALYLAYKKINMKNKKN